MAVAAMRAENSVLRSQMSADPRRNGLLTDVSMTSAVNQAALMRFRQLFLTAANKEHGPVQTQEAVLVGRDGCHELLGGAWVHGTPAIPDCYTILGGTVMSGRR